MRAIPQLVSAPFNPIPIAEHFRPRLPTAYTLNISIIPLELSLQTSPHQMAGRNSWHGGHRKGLHSQRSHSPTDTP